MYLLVLGVLLFALTARPIADDLFDLAPAADQVTVVGVSDSNEHCYVVNDCQMLVANTSFDCPSPVLPTLPTVLLDVALPALSPASPHAYASALEPPPPRTGV